MTDRRCMRPRRGRITHAVPVAGEQRSECNKDANGWVVSDDAPNCKACLRAMINLRN